jgi:hypothetical protein
LAPEQIDAIENLLFFLFALLSVPFAWLYAQKRGRRPWLWSLFAFFIAWVAILLLRLLPVGGSQSLQRVTETKVMKPTTRLWLNELVTSKRNRIFASYLERKLPELLSAVQNAPINGCRVTMPYLSGGVVADYLAAFHYELNLF